MPKMTAMNLYDWIDSTINEIKTLLDIHKIPYEDGAHGMDNIKGNLDVDPAYAIVTKQIVFPWCKGDVVVGTLHTIDDEVITGKADICKFPYPSIETYKFPWDQDDITVFDTPAEFVRRLRGYYAIIKGWEVEIHGEGEKV